MDRVLSPPGASAIKKKEKKKKKKKLHWLIKFKKCYLEKALIIITFFI